MPSAGSWAAFSRQYLMNWRRKRSAVARRHIYAVLPLFFFDHCFASSGSNVAKSLIPAITLAPEHIGHFSPLERALTLVCHSCPQAPLHHTFLFEPKVMPSGVSGKFFSDHSVISSGCTSAKLLFITKPQPPCA